MDGRKWPEQRHWQFTMERLGQDEHGVWLHVPAGSLAQRADEPPRRLEVGFVSLIPSGRWWTAEFYASHLHWQVYVNIGTPAEWLPGRVRQVDLDLDVVRNLDGSVEVLDEDEFADHQVRLGYPPELIDSARTAASEIVAALEGGTEPFGSAARPWLEEAARRQRD